MVMLVSANAKRLMLGYLLGAYLTAITSGLVIVFALPDSGAVDTTQDTLSPALDLALGVIAIVVGIVLSTGATERAERARRRSAGASERRRGRRAGSGRSTAAPRASRSRSAPCSASPAPHIWSRSASCTGRISSTAATVLSVIAFCLIELILLELPLIGFAVAPDRTVAAIARFRAFVTHDARRIGAWAAFVVGALLLIRGAIELLL